MEGVDDVRLDSEAPSVAGEDRDFIQLTIQLHSLNLPNYLDDLCPPHLSYGLRTRRWR